MAAAAVIFLLSLEENSLLRLAPSLPSTQGRHSRSLPALPHSHANGLANSRALPINFVASEMRRKKREGGA